MRASRHVIRRPEPVVDDAVPEVVEPTTNATMRIDMIKLDPLLLESRDADEDAEIVVVAEGSQELPRVERNRLAHTLPRGVKQAPAAIIAPVAAIAPPVADDARPIDELAEARAAAAQIDDVPRRKRVGVVFVALACAVALVAAYMVYTPWTL